MARGGRGGCGKYSANTKSYVAGKISGQYRAKGYSRARSQRIGNAVVAKMGSTFKSGRGSKGSYTKGYKLGYGYSASKQYQFRTTTGILNDHNHNVFSITQSRLGSYETRDSSTESHGKHYGKHYGKRYERHYR